MQLMDSEGFQLVSKKKAARRKNLKTPGINLNLPQDSVNECVKKIRQAQAELLSSEGFSDLRNNLKNITEASPRSQNDERNQCKVFLIVCYGLGLPSSSRIAKYQTALLLILQDYFSVDVEVYDPAFTSVDISVLKEFEFKILTENEEGKRRVEVETVFYMPHCGKELYNNLLWANWNPLSLSRCIVIGNSLSSIVQNVPTRVLKQHYQFIHSAAGLFQEYPLKTLVEYDDIFNDVSVHNPTTDKVNEKGNEFWHGISEPKYEDCDIEIVRIQTERVTLKTNDSG